jgi:MFS family permease
MRTIARWVSPYFHYGWVVVALCFLVMTTVSGVRAAPGVLILPLEQAFGWTRTTISTPLATSLLLFGLLGPFAAAIMQRFGIRRVVLTSLSVLVVGAGLSNWMTEPWQMMATWGLLVGLGTGMMAMVFGAIVTNRWFAERKGLVIGILTAGMAAGQLIFLPGLAAIVDHGGGWRPVVWVVTIAALAIIPLIFLFLPERPSDVGLLPYGAKVAEPPPPPPGNLFVVPFTVLFRGMRDRNFWLLFGSFFVCGLSTNGLVGTHLIPACVDQGMTAVTAASFLAGMGVFNMVGTTASGWASDRFDNRWLLFWYYGLRGISLLYLPYSGFTFYGLSIFAIFYGLDWIATVPPTVRLANDSFVKRDAAVLYGWVFVGHQAGAFVAAAGAGWIRTALDRYLEAFIIAGIACLVAAALVLLIGRAKSMTLRPAEAAT